MRTQDGQRRCVRRSCTRRDQRERRYHTPPLGPRTLVCALYPFQLLGARLGSAEIGNGRRPHAVAGCGYDEQKRPRVRERDLWIGG